MAIVAGRRIRLGVIFTGFIVGVLALWEPTALQTILTYLNKLPPFLRSVLDGLILIGVWMELWGGDSDEPKARGR